MSYENPGFDGYPFTNERVAADLTIIPDLGAFLNFNKCAYPSLIADFAPVKIDESINPHVSTELHVRRDPAIVWKLVTDRPELQLFPRTKFHHKYTEFMKDSGL